MGRFAELSDLRDRCAVVLGGGGAIGSTAVATLSGLGARVAVVDVDERRGGDVAARTGGIVVRCDVADEHATRLAMRAVRDELGGVDILVHAAALVGVSEFDGWSVPFEDQTVEAFEQALRVNLVSAFVCVQQLAGELRRSGHGSVILLGSIYGVAGPVEALYSGTSMVNPAGYGASKGGILQLTRHLATTLAPDVRVNTISPGGVLRGQPTEFVERYADRTPLRRMATEDDLVGAIAFLASDLSAYVTGHNLVVDGGWTAW